MPLRRKARRLLGCRFIVGPRRMASFPLISELPQLVETVGWTWKPFQAPSVSSYGFWLGSDGNGNRWLTKLGGSFRAYREIVFAKLAQAMGWSCQSSMFVRIDRHSAAVLNVPAGEVHSAHWYMDEHPQSLCSSSCPLAFIRNRSIQGIEDLEGSDIAHLLDWPKGELAAYLFGGHEPPDRLFTFDHELVIIDSELMFASDPCHFKTSPWLSHRDGSPSLRGRALAREVCCDFASLLDSDLEYALRVPKGIRIERPWPIASILRKSRKVATQVCTTNEWPNPSLHRTLRDEAAQRR